MNHVQLPYLGFFFRGTKAFLLKVAQLATGRNTMEATDQARNSPFLALELDLQFCTEGCGLVVNLVGGEP